MTQAQDDVLATAKERFRRCVDAYSEAREKAREDIRFAAASPDDPWQWYERDLKSRKSRPTLTVNKLPAHIRQVTNDMRMNRPAIKLRPADGEADAEVADLMMGVVRDIEATSKADTAYDTAGEHAVVMGEGYVRVLPDYASLDSFEQEIRIVAVPRPFSVWLDPDRQDPVGSDARFAFVEEQLSEEDFKAEYPKADAISWDFGEDDWIDRGAKTIRVAEYFEVVDKPAKLLQWFNGSTSYEGDPPPAGVYPGERPQRERQSVKRTIVWRKINGQQILEEREFPSRYIGIVRVVGNEWMVDGKAIWSGIVRNAKDAQRIYNIAASAIVERVMQAPKAPWTLPAEAVEGHEKVWQTANTGNHAFLPYNHQDEQGNPIPPPVRNMPATVEPGLTEVLRNAAEDMKAATSQFDASLGRQSNETSGRAIMARQREGDTANFHFIDNLRRAIEQIGRIVVDMYPRIYTAARVARIVGMDGEATAARMDPSLPQALVKGRDETGALQRSFNPTVGRYDVYATAGPSFTTKRLEAVDAMTAMTQASPQLWGVIGDQLVKNMDWPGAEEMAKRLKATLIPQVQEVIAEEESQPEVPPQVMQAMQQMGVQVEQMQQALQRAAQMISDAERKAQEEEAKRLKAEIEADRNAALLDVAQARAEVIETVSQRQQPEPQQPMPPAAPSVIVVDNSEKVAELIAGVTGNMTAALDNTTQAVAAMAANQGPRVASVVVQRQPDGSYVGQRVEQ